MTLGTTRAIYFKYSLYVLIHLFLKYASTTSWNLRDYSLKILSSAHSDLTFAHSFMCIMRKQVFAFILEKFYIYRWSTLHCRRSCRKKDRQKRMLWHSCRWLPTESLRTQSFSNRSTLSRCVTAQQTSYQKNKAFSSIGKRGFLERPLKYRHPSLIQTLLTAWKKVLCTLRII